MTVEWRHSLNGDNIISTDNNRTRCGPNHHINASSKKVNVSIQGATGDGGNPAIVQLQAMSNDLPK
jgi:hypothetical protein